MEAFFVENPVAERVSGLFATSINDRIEALRRYPGSKPYEFATLRGALGKLLGGLPASE
jgi:hypothetical protein